LVAVNLETALELAGANSLTIKEYKLRHDLALADAAKAKEWWLPDLYAGTSVHQLWGNAMNGNGAIFTDVNRQNFWGGLGVNASWDFGKGPFLTDAADLKAQAVAFATEAEQNKALLTIIETYYDFLVAQLYAKEYAQLAKQAEIIADQIEIQVSAGLLYQSELLLAQSNYNHLQVQMMTAQMEQNNHSALLVQLLNLDPMSQLISVDSVLMPLELKGTTVSLDGAFEPAYQKRPELKSMDLTLQALNAAKKTTTTGLLLPKLSVGGYGSYFGGVFSPIGPTSEINASLIWTIPTGRLVYAGELKQFDARIALQENQILQAKATINKDLLSSRARILNSKARLDIALDGSRLAEKALDQCVQRQNLGTVRPFEILQAQEVYIKSRLDYLTSVSLYNKAQYQLFVAEGNNL
jgi:outer membrane protein TolC